MIHFFSEGGSTMTLEPVECPVCGGTNVIKHGKSGEGKQRYLCQDQACCGKTFVRDYSLKVYRLTAFEKQFVLSFMAVKSLEGLRGTCWPALPRSRKELNHPFILSSRGQP